MNKFKVITLEGDPRLITIDTVAESVLAQNAIVMSIGNFGIFIIGWPKDCNLFFENDKLTILNNRGIRWTAMHSMKITNLIPYISHEDVVTNLLSLL